MKPVIAICCYDVFTICVVLFKMHVKGCMLIFFHQYMFMDFESKL